MTARTRIAVLLSVSVVALAGCGSDDGEASDPAPATSTAPSEAASEAASETASETPSETASQPASEPPSAAPSETASASPSATASAAVRLVTVPVYFTGDTPQGTRLYREFRKVRRNGSDGAALTLAASGNALDPDYGTLLPAGTFADITYDESIVVPLPDDSWTRRPAGMSEDDALLAIQQIVYTVQGVLQRRSAVVFTDSDGGATQIFGFASEDGFTAADPIETLALVNVTTPAEGAKVSGSFVATGVSSSFEATIAWELRRGGSDGAVVRRGSAMALGWMDKLYPWRTKVRLGRLAPGAYTFVARTDDPTGGEGPGPMEDTKSIIVG